MLEGVKCVCHSIQLSVSHACSASLPRNLEFLVGLITTLAILLHEIPHEVGDFAILLRSGFNRWKAAKAQFLTASGGVVGAITALTSESTKTAGDKAAWILPFTSGGFMYIALVTVVPDLLQEKHGWESLKQVGLYQLFKLLFIQILGFIL
ncbi:hypothetical protein Btru_052111 [Bulinus truncatus]|nr:hypothetical protein Btru_052111 [Bulinus truncatus]